MLGMGVLGLTLFALVVNYNIQLTIPPMTVQLQHPIDNTTNDGTGTGGRDCGHRCQGDRLRPSKPRRSRHDATESSLESCSRRTGNYTESSLESCSRRTGNYTGSVESLQKTNCVLPVEQGMQGSRERSRERLKRSV
jgi:hypothetical protein